VTLGSLCPELGRRRGVQGARERAQESLRRCHARRWLPRERALDGRFDRAAALPVELEAGGSQLEQGSAAIARIALAAKEPGVFQTFQQTRERARVHVKRLRQLACRDAALVTHEP
jgi:hypothetical protein